MSFIFFSCGEEDESIDLNGTWYRDTCNDTSVIDFFIFKGDSVFVQPYKGTTHEFICGYYPNQNSTFTINEDGNSIHFIANWFNDPMYNKLGQYQWFIDSLSDDFIRYIAYDIHNDIAHTKLLELKKE